MRTEATEVVEDGTRRDRRGRRMVGAEQREGLVRAFHASGLTQAGFARREGLNPKTLSHWLAPQARGRARATSPVSFARVSVPFAARSAALALEVALPDGTLVRGDEVGAVAELVRALRD